MSKSNKQVTFKKVTLKYIGLSSTEESYKFKVNSGLKPPIVFLSKKDTEGKPKTGTTIKHRVLVCDVVKYKDKNGNKRKALCISQAY